MVTLCPTPVEPHALGFEPEYGYEEPEHSPVAIEYVLPDEREPEEIVPPLAAIVTPVQPNIRPVVLNSNDDARRRMFESLEAVGSIRTNRVDYMAPRFDSSSQLMGANDEKKEENSLMFGDVSVGATLRLEPDMRFIPVGVLTQESQRSAGLPVSGDQFGHRLAQQDLPDARANHASGHQIIDRFAEFDARPPSDNYQNAYAFGVTIDSESENDSSEQDGDQDDYEVEYEDDDEMPPLEQTSAPVLRRESTSWDGRNQSAFALPEPSVVAGWNSDLRDAWAEIMNGGAPLSNPVHFVAR